MFLFPEWERPQKEDKAKQLNAKTLYNHHFFPHLNQTDCYFFLFFCDFSAQPTDSTLLQTAVSPESPVSRCLEEPVAI